MTIQLRQLNEVGMAKFASWLDNPVCEPPKSLLEDDSASLVVEGGYRIDPSRKFSTSYELGEYLATDVFKENTDNVALLSNHSMWAWLSLALIDSLVNRSGRGAGLGKPLDKPHYMHSPRLAYRLIVRTAWDLVALHGAAAKLALSSSTSPWGDMAEQMTARQEIYAHHSFWITANVLYALPDGSAKTGAASRRSKTARHDPKSKAGLGGVRRLPFTFRQFERTYNLRQMTADHIASLLPNEYKRWVSS